MSTTIESTEAIRGVPLPEAHDAAVAHQFDDLVQQGAAARLGMFLFLATEILFFGGLFCGYTIYRYAYLPAFMSGSRLLEVRFGATNTAVLIISSLTMALAVRAAQLGKKKHLIIFLFFTLLLGLAFIGIKLRYEWYHDWLEHWVPGLRWGYSGLRSSQVELFMFFYFVMTGIHALHMVVGCGIVTTLIIMSWRGAFTSERHNAIEIAGLYWHFVDIVWIFLFPLLYLIGGRY